MTKRSLSRILFLPIGAVLAGGFGLHLAQALPAPTPAAPAGDFDWCVPPGQTLVLDTSFTQLVGGPHCVPTQTSAVVNGVLDAGNIWIQQGATVRVQGPHPLVIHASGEVRIDGKLDLSGFSSPGVLTLNTTATPELGALGVAGGGRGGNSSSLTTDSTPIGDSGFGAFDTPGLGGGGGETGWTKLNPNPDRRRGAGGGGGALGHNQVQPGGPALGDWDQSYIGLDVESGFANLNAFAYGALTGLAGPFGGPEGVKPFFDGDPTNDFYGLAIDTNGNLIVGELQTPWAGAGGGGGGDASLLISGSGGAFPPVPFNPSGDEKGGSGGGGGGSLSILAVGDIVFGPTGLILARGGSGGSGENTIAKNRVGGGGGGGSGGHVILQTLGVIDLRQSLGASAVRGVLAGGVLATGGQGAAGAWNFGGAQFNASGTQDTAPSKDACPKTLAGGEYPTRGPNACLGHVDGAGGDGGPGLVQLHTRTGLDPLSPSILLPAGVELGDLIVPTPVCSEPGCKLVPDLP